MAGNSILVINAAGAETRVSLVENGNIHEYYLERKREKGIVGNIYKGRVVRVLPGMQAAFVDIGLEKAAFLYVGDVYGDPDFSEEFELTEGEHRAEVNEVPTEQEAEEAEARAQLAVPEPSIAVGESAGGEGSPEAAGPSGLGEGALASPEAGPREATSLGAAPAEERVPALPLAEPSPTAPLPPSPLTPYPSCSERGRKGGWERGCVRGAELSPPPPPRAPSPPTARCGTSA